MKTFNILPLAFLQAKNAASFITPYSGHSLSIHNKKTHQSTSLDAKRKKKNFVTVQQLIDEATKDAERILADKKTAKIKSTRTRKRVERPKQKYMYAAQRKSLERSGEGLKNKGDDENEEVEEEAASIRVNLDKKCPTTIARNLGMNPASQFCDASFAVVATGIEEGNSFKTVINANEPRIVGKLRVGGDDSEGLSGMFAYVIEKPAGWAILEAAKKKKKNPVGEKNSKAPVKAEKSRKTEKSKFAKGKNKGNQKQTKYYDQETDAFDVVDYDQKEMFSVMTSEEIEEFESDGGFDEMDLSDSGAQVAKAAANAVSQYDDDEQIEALVDKTKKEIAEATSDSVVETSKVVSNTGPANFATDSRPCVVAWLKELKAAEGTPIRGGKFWTAIAGAVDIDDSGLLLLCPKDKVDNVYVDNATYSAVVGNGNYLAPKGKKKQQVAARNMASINESKLEIVAKLRKGRDDDVVLTAMVSIPDGASIANDAVQVCQKELLDGVRGDPSANPLDRRANRRLVHCTSLAVSSLSFDDVIETEIEVSEDIRMYSDRRNHHEYQEGSFLGRGALRANEHTTAYREVNGAADGFPGWLVDRYDKWLFVQHDEDFEKGPLPSLHDGNTAGVYYFATERDRSVTGSKKGIKPKLLEGTIAPEIIPIKENGITYHVNFDELSTGIFLDQRSQRAWLSRFCTTETKVLNCFSHCGAFSIAAATAGAETVSLDLDKKWLDRVGPQLKANGIDESDGRHDCIYGDCFDWLRRLGKRGDKFDIVIVDPPSTSVGGKKKKRWSAKNDYDELVSLAAPLLKEGGLLWATTNSNQIHPIKFARMCEKGLVAAGISDAKLERVAAMPSDFPTIGPQSVKNLVWRMPAKSENM